jgi:RNase P/RNase MRP subunit p29
VQIGIEGKIVNETMKMLVLETAKGKKCIKKRGTVFKVWLGDGTVEIDGNAVVGRPEERIKTVIKKW